jgi:hypothetical protein
MVNAQERVRGTPHPFEPVEMTEQPSPSRGEGAITHTALAVSYSPLTFLMNPANAASCSLIMSRVV